jgi:hypothetical protein
MPAQETASTNAEDEQHQSQSDGREKPDGAVCFANLMGVTAAHAAERATEHDRNNPHEQPPTAGNGRQNQVKPMLRLVSAEEPFLATPQTPIGLFTHCHIAPHEDSASYSSAIPQH